MLASCIDNLTKQREKAIADIARLKLHREQEASEEEIDNPDKLFIQKQTIQQLPKIDFEYYEKFIVESASMQFTSHPEKKRKRLFDLDLSSEEDSEEEEDSDEKDA